jgi:transcriptional regulator with XRE-family HTH domain
MSIAERIRKLRLSKKMSQRQLGERIGRTQQEMYRWEKGLVRVHADDVGLMAEALGVPVNAFFDDTDCTGEQVDWELQAASSNLPQQDKQKLIDFLSTAYGPNP